MDSAIRVALADDHPLTRGGIIEIIKEDCPSCIVVAEAVNGRDLIDKIGLLEIKPDISLLDISMPVLNGYDTLFQLKKLYPSMKFIVLSGYNHEYCVVWMIRHGANGFVSKDTGCIGLVDAITAVYNHGYYYSATASEKAFKAVKNSVANDLTERETQYVCLAANWKLSYVQIGVEMGVSVLQYRATRIGCVKN